MQVRIKISSKFMALEVTQTPLCINPFQSNFSATRILPSSYLFWAEKGLVDYL
jgi:hypothetical protein